MEPKKRAARGAAEDPIYTTLDQIVDRMPHVGSVDTVIRYADLRRDPLRLRYRCGRPWIQESVLSQWLVRTFGTAEERQTLQKIRGKDAICGVFGASWRTILKYVALAVDPLPIEGGNGVEPWIYRSALIDWVAAHDVPRAVHSSGWDWKGPSTHRDDVCPPAKCNRRP